MTRLEGIGAWFCICLGAVFLGASTVVVPATAFADAGGDDCYTTCSGDPICMQMCCETACGDNQTCTDQCMAQQAAAISCLQAVCEDKLGDCTTTCNQQPCNDGGKDPNQGAKCNSVTYGCRCQ